MTFRNPQRSPIIHITLHIHVRTHTHFLSHSLLFSSPLLSGVQCGECSAGFYGNPRISGAPCRPCACSNNIDVTDPGSCSPVTGECLKCLYNTQGPNCQLCKPGYFGSALNQTCTSKSAKLLAGNVATWTVVATPVLTSVRSVVPAPTETGLMSIQQQKWVQCTRSSVSLH